jgi:hydrogenase maturation protein HypF
MRKTNKIIYTKIQLPFEVKKPILAFGSQAKNRVCFARDKFAYLSPVHQDLSNPKEFLAFKKTLKYFLNKTPKIIAYDLHPEYQSTKYALSLPTTYYLLPTQHHHAHIASCMAENGLKNRKVIGVAFDGTGLGSDNRIWGAEFLICDYKDFKRKAHLKEIPLLGQERAILEPSRLVLVWLYLIYKESFLNFDIGFFKGIDRKKWQVLKNMYLSGFNSPLASSMGRFFDAAASLILAKGKAHFEAELAIELEKLATGHRLPCLPAGKQATSCRLKAPSYKFRIIKSDNEYILDPLPMFKQIVSDLKARESKEKIAYRFHVTVAEMIKRICLILKEQSKINRVVLSGGVFQNRLLLNLTLNLLYKEDFKVITHRVLSCNDSCLSLGQAAIANYRS